MEQKERKERMIYFPKDGKNKIVRVLMASHDGVSPVNERTVGAILRGERGDRHGVIDIFRSITDDIRQRTEDALKELKTSGN